MILWSDDEVLVINKPAGLRSIPDGYDPTLPTVVSILTPEWGKCWVVHRLDKDTSGVMLMARTAQAHRNLSLQFEHREVKKEYHAIIVGVPTWNNQTVSQPLRINGDRRHRTVIDLHTGKPAQTDIEVMERFAGHSLVKALPHTGYTHQIRAHLSAAGFPLLGDALYWLAGQPAPLPQQLLPDIIQRTALHAFSIHFFHPITAQPLSFSAPYADDFASAVTCFRPTPVD